MNLNTRIEVNTRQVIDLLTKLSEEYPGTVAFSTSFSLEDQVITDIVFRNDLPIEVFTLDTGRLFEETYKVWDETLKMYPNRRISAYYPNENELKRFVDLQGPNSFYDSLEQRLRCCEIRKVEPLKRVLSNKKCWITGIRKQHSPNRASMEPKEWDANYELFKYHPLLMWTSEEVTAYIDQYRIPYNVLHDRGFASIGCAPCTRAIAEWEDPRAGRWWWELSTKKECGLHLQTNNNK